MRVFVTGASGFIGSATVLDLLAAGHEVVGLARSDESAAAITAAGAEVRRGDLHDLESLRDGADASDGVIHLAYIHDFSDMAGAAAADLRAIETMGDALEDSDRPLVIASGVVGLAEGRPGTEEDWPTGGHPRVANALAARALGERGVRSSIVRLAPTVHGEGDHGFVARFVDIAREHGASGYIGDGANRWPAIHRLDAARLFRLALEQAPAGSVLHGVAEEGVPTREIAEAIARGLGVPAVSVSADHAADQFGFLAMFFSLDLPVSNALTRARYEWEPAQPGLIADLDEGHYFE